MSIIYAVANNGGISAYINGEMKVVAPDHKRYAEVLKALEAQDTEQFLYLTDLARRINDYVSASGKLAVKNSQVLYKGITIEFPFTHRLLEMMEKGLPYGPYVNYIERTMRNPRPRCVKSLDLLINRPDAKYPLPLLPDGRFLAYKRVREDFYDHHSGKVLYEPLEVKYKDHPQAKDMNWLHSQVGNRVGMPIWETDDNFQLACSAGFHAGLYEYVATFHANEGHVLAVAVCPSQVISVPEDASAMKFRTHALEVRHIIPETFIELLFDPTGAASRAAKPATTRYNDESDDLDDFEEEEIELEDSEIDDEDEDEINREDDRYDPYYRGH